MEAGNGGGHGCEVRMGCTALALGVAWRKESYGGKNNCHLDVEFSFKLSTIIF